MHVKLQLCTSSFINVLYFLDLFLLYYTVDKGTNHVDKVSIDARFTRDTPNNSHVTMFVTWNDVTWENSENITYFKVQIRKGRSVIPYYVNASSNVSDWPYTAVWYQYIVYNTARLIKGLVLVYIGVLFMSIQVHHC